MIIFFRRDQQEGGGVVKARRESNGERAKEVKNNGVTKRFLFFRRKRDAVDI